MSETTIEADATATVNVSKSVCPQCGWTFPTRSGHETYCGCWLACSASCAEKLEDTPHVCRRPLGEG